MAEKETICQKVVQTCAVAAMVFTQIGVSLISPLLACYIILATKYWWICILYVAWYLTIDKDSETTGSRLSEWVRSWSWWTQACKYYPVKAVKLPWGELDKKKNYLFCYFPHGMLSTGSFFTMASNTTEFSKFFPHHKRYIHTVSAFYKIPFIRELGLLLGGVGATKEALEYILGNKNGGNISGLVIGGAQEAYFCNPGVHKIIYKKRKGFIKIALRTGAPLVPVYVFGENDLFSQVELDPDSILQKLREFFRKKIGFSIIIPVGRKELLGLVPNKTPLTIVVGEPIDVQKTENPSQEQIDNLHQLFQDKLVELFENQKKYYLKDYETAHLEIC